MQLAFDCRRWRTLPRTGALFEQDLATMVRMSTALNVFNSFKAYADRDNIKNFGAKYPETVEFCHAVDVLRETGHWPEEDKQNEID